MVVLLGRLAVIRAAWWFRVYYMNRKVTGWLVSSPLKFYWMMLIHTVAMQVYNSSKYWMCVKAQHLEFLERVLSDSTHPRYEYYHILNAQFRQMPQEYVNILTPSATLKARRENERPMVPVN